MPDVNAHRAAEQLYESLTMMGAADSNPVLQVLPCPHEIVQGKKYPPGNLQFGGLGLRAYYHSHARPHVRRDEHGHFHVFIHMPDDNEVHWSHLVALSVDAQGQPQKWMTVNRWVTGSRWCLAGELDAALATLPVEPADLSPVELWLYSLLCLYRPEIRGLLEKRDTRIHAMTVDKELTQVLEDRRIYTLSEAGTDLLEDLAPLFARQA